MAHTRTPPAVITKVGREQHGFPLAKTICPWCGKPGATEPHHWLLKRSDHPPDQLLHQPVNVVLLHPWCHNQYGQTETMTVLCYLHKRGWLTTYSGLPYDVLAWLKTVSRQLTHNPIIPKEVYHL